MRWRWPFFGGEPRLDAAEIRRRLARDSQAPSMPDSGDDPNNAAKELKAAVSVQRSVDNGWLER
jgi:hypothetical protein